MIYKVIAKLKSLFLYPFQFKHFGKRSRIDKPLRIEGKKYIEIEDHVLVQPYTWLACQPLTGCERPMLKIGKGCTIGHLNHIYATEGIVFEDYVLTADKVYISDNLHSYENPDVPIVQQAVVQAFTPPPPPPPPVVLCKMLHANVQTKCVLERAVGWVRMCA